MNELQVYAKDRIKINVLSDLKAGRAQVSVYLESDGRDMPYAELNPANASAFRYNNFNVTETPEDDSVTFCPVVVGCPAVITLSVPAAAASPGAVSLFRKDSLAPELTHELAQGKNRVALSPIDLKRYVLLFEPAGACAPESDSKTEADPSLPARAEALRIGNASMEAGAAAMEREIADLEARRAALSERRKKLRERLEWLSANSGEAPDELDELAAIFGVDKEILAYYEDPEPDSDVLKLTEEVKSGIEKLEEQIRLFVTRKEAKNGEIERQLKTGGR
jgi:hypothetical protein